MFTDNCESSIHSISKLFFNCCDEKLANSSNCMRKYFSIFYPCENLSSCKDQIKSSHIPQIKFGNLPVWPLSGSCRVSKHWFSTFITIFSNF